MRDTRKAKGRFQMRHWIAGCFVGGLLIPILTLTLASDLTAILLGVSLGLGLTIISMLLAVLDISAPIRRR